MMDYDGFRQSKLVSSRHQFIESRMQRLEEEIFNFDPKQIQRKIGSRSAVRIRSSREKETESRPLAGLTQSYRQLAESVKGAAKKRKKHTTFSALTREMILKRRSEAHGQEARKQPATLEQLTVFN